MRCVRVRVCGCSDFIKAANKMPPLTNLRLRSEGYRVVTQ
jgi:hypothetical protein